jgi:ubiquitin-conjugating enzyme E2 Z
MNWPTFEERMIKYENLFSTVDYYEHYVRVCKKNMTRDGQAMRDPFGETRGKFDYKTLLRRVEAIHTRLSGSAASSSTAGACSSTSADADVPSST